MCWWVGLARGAHALISIPSYGMADAAGPSSLQTSVEKEGEKPVCKYGESCYRKNPQHFLEFDHPWLSTLLDSHMM